MMVKIQKFSSKLSSRNSTCSEIQSDFKDLEFCLFLKEKKISTELSSLNSTRSEIHSDGRSLGIQQNFELLPASFLDLLELSG